MQRTSFKLALVQMLVEGGDKAANLRRAVERINEAAVNGARVIVLPEAMTLGWTHSSAKTGADGIPDGHSCSTLCEAARRRRVYVCSRLINRQTNPTAAAGRAFAVCRARPGGAPAGARYPRA